MNENMFALQQQGHNRFQLARASNFLRNVPLPSVDLMNCLPLSTNRTSSSWHRVV